MHFSERRLVNTSLREPSAYLQQQAAGKSESIRVSRQHLSLGAHLVWDENKNATVDTAALKMIGLCCKRRSPTQRMCERDRTPICKSLLPSLFRRQEEDTFLLPLLSGSASLCTYSYRLGESTCERQHVWHWACIAVGPCSGLISL